MTCLSIGPDRSQGVQVEIGVEIGVQTGVRIELAILDFLPKKENMRCD